jgi:hypothetical protein
VTDEAPVVQSLATVDSVDALRAAMLAMPGWARGKARWDLTWLPHTPRVDWNAALEIVRRPAK